MTADAIRRVLPHIKAQHARAAETEEGPPDG